MTARLALVEQPPIELRQTILDGLRGFNRTLFGPVPAGQDLAIAIRDTEDRAVGGLWGRTAGGWLAIEIIFVPDNLRGTGLGTRLITMAEDEAMRRGCGAAWLDALNPDAVRLYHKLGYIVFGELPEYPVGFTRYFLKKKLTS